jgi:hypothetical protein
VRRLRKRLLRDLESVRRNLECRNDLPPSRRLMGQEVLCLISEDLAAHVTMEFEELVDFVR